MPNRHKGFFFFNLFTLGCRDSPISCTAFIVSPAATQFLCPPLKCAAAWERAPASAQGWLQSWDRRVEACIMHGLLHSCRDPRQTRRRFTHCSLVSSQTYAGSPQVGLDPQACMFTWTLRAVHTCSNSGSCVQNTLKGAVPLLYLVPLASISGASSLYLLDVDL